jgi:hypothetical protein
MSTSTMHSHREAGAEGAPPLPRLLSRVELHALIGRGQRAGSFTNWLYRATRLHGFPRPVLMGARAVAWREDEVRAWLESRPRGGGERNAVRRRPTEAA